MEFKERAPPQPATGKRLQKQRAKQKNTKKKKTVLPPPLAK